MKLRSRVLPAAAAAALLLAACDAGDDAQDPGVEDTDTGATEDTDDGGILDDDLTGDDTLGEDTAEEQALDPEDAEVQLDVVSSELGDHVVDAEGRSLYVSSDDEEGVSNCLNDCAQIWPPVLVDGEPTAIGELDETLLGTTERDDDTGTQVTYNGWPLYWFVSDAEPGDTRGQGVNGTWWLIGGDGEPIAEGGIQDEPGDADAGTDEDTDAEGDEDA
ncbi:COG4315 family predicted lipoprotein [Egicoccus halophilus]|uniref:Lipoprotein with Yx(FWY)xxD motif n=1 Tax=Egicoccus halophilus TaxID=1670830 RepID=A0A8J3AB33_9ACTN|nr:hypothetical protein [Egicoccus halophilus]GGI09233.1 hypothetical protein GCM10011354_33060 [Egicoccus halophilus]